MKFHLQAGMQKMFETASDAQRLMAEIKPLIAKAEAIAAEARARAICLPGLETLVPLQHH